MPASDTPHTSLTQTDIPWWIFTLLACAGFAFRYVYRGGSFLNLHQYAAGLEQMPYQGRILMSWVLHATADNPYIYFALLRLYPHVPVEIRSAYSIIMILVDFIAMMIAVITGRLSLLYLTGDRVFSSWSSLLIIYMSYFNLIVGYGIFMMPYDVVSLAVFTTSVWLILTERYLWMLPVVILGELNRETAIFIPIYLGLYIWFSRKSKNIKLDKIKKWPWALQNVVLQVFACLVIRLWIGHHFRNNPLEGDMHNRWMIFHVGQNLLSLSKPAQWPLFLSLFGFTLPLFVAKFNNIGNKPFARSTAAIIVLFLLVSLFIGVYDEIRIFNELTAFIMPCVALIIWNKWILPASKYNMELDA